MLNFTTRNGLASNVVTRMHQDPDGTLWIGTNNGLHPLPRRGSFAPFGSPTASRAA